MPFLDLFPLFLSILSYNFLWHLFTLNFLAYFFLSHFLMYNLLWLKFDFLIRLSYNTFFLLNLSLLWQWSQFFILFLNLSIWKWINLCLNLPLFLLSCYIHSWHHFFLSHFFNWKSLTLYLLLIWSIRKQIPYLSSIAYHVLYVYSMLQLFEYVSSHLVS